MASSNQIVPEIVDAEVPELLEIPVVPEVITRNDAVVPSTTLHKMYVELMRNYKQLKQENEELKEKNNDLNEENNKLNNDCDYFQGEFIESDTLYGDVRAKNVFLEKDMEKLKKKHDAEMKSMRFHSNHNANIACRRADEIKKLKDEKEDMGVIIDNLVDEKKELQKKYDDVVKEKEDAEKNFYSNHNALTYVQSGNEVRKLKKELDRAYKQEREDMDEIDELKMENKHFYQRESELTDDRNMLRDTVEDLRSVISRQNKELVMWQDCYEQSWNYEEE